MFEYFLFCVFLVFCIGISFTEVIYSCSFIGWRNTLLFKGEGRFVCIDRDGCSCFLSADFFNLKI